MPKPTTPPRQVEYTTEYDVFVRLSGNRNVDKLHVKNLAKAMQEKYIFSPILVNQNFEVMDGQHRLEAHKLLGLPVPFYWDETGDLADVQNINNTQKSWSNADYVKSFIERGFQDYKTYQWFRDAYDLPHSVSVTLLTGTSRGVRKVFQSGLFKVKNLELAKKKAKILTEIAPYFTHWKDAGFLMAMNIALNKKGFDIQQFIHRVATNSTMLVPCVSVDQYLKLIEEVYNFRSVKKVSIRFGEDDEKSKWK